MPLGVRVYPQSYYDSVVLAMVARELRRLPGVRDTAVVMGTGPNRRWLQQAGLLQESSPGSGAEDLLVCVHAETSSLVEQSLDRAEALLVRHRPDWELLSTFSPRTLRTALRLLPQSNLAVISVRGRYAARLCREALEQGLHVFLFSGGLSLEEERLLKDEALRRGLFFLGPAAGAVVLNGVSFGFASILPRGHVALVGTDGGAIQQVATLLVREERQVGVSHALVTGIRDLGAAIGGRATIGAVRALLDDPETNVLVLLGARPDADVARQMVALLQQGGKPAVVAWPGFSRDELRQAGLIPARTLQEAALLAVALDRGLPLEAVPKTLEAENEGLYSQARVLAKLLRPGQRYSRGLYSCRSLCQEAEYILEGFLGTLHTNLADPADDVTWRSIGHTMVDMGAEALTMSWLHPTLDCAQRNRRLLQEAEDPGVAVILLDVILGVGAHPDPAGEMAPVIQSVRAIADTGGRELLVLASVCGTRADPQDLWAQEEKLRDAGVILLPSNSAAAKLAGLIVQNQQGV